MVNIVQHPANLLRAQFAERHLPSEGETLDKRITAALADLRHLCDREGLDFADLDRSAYTYYSLERGLN